MRLAWLTYFRRSRRIDRCRQRDERLSRAAGEIAEAKYALAKLYGCHRNGQYPGGDMGRQRDVAAAIVHGVAAAIELEGFKAK